MGTALALGQVVRFVLAFGLVLLAAWGASRWLGRRGAAGGHGALRLLGGVSLGSGRSLCLVQVGRRVLVLGLADKEIRLLSSIRDPDELALLGVELQPPPQPSPGDRLGPAAWGQAYRHLREAARRAVGRDRGDGE